MQPVYIGKACVIVSLGCNTTYTCSLGFKLAKDLAAFILAASKKLWHVCSWPCPATKVTKITMLHICQVLRSGIAMTAMCAKMYYSLALEAYASMGACLGKLAMHGAMRQPHHICQLVWLLLQMPAESKSQTT